MIDINWKPSPKELRTFGLAFLVAAGVLGGILAWRIGLGTPSYVLWALGPVVAAIGLLAPRWLRPLYLALTLLAYPIGMVVGTVLLAITYYGVVTAVGLGFRLLGKDPMHRRVDRDAATYWIERPRRREVARYFRQF